MTESFDVIVVGGGPGGSSSAAFLSGHGRKTLLLDAAKFPRDKICGDAISGKSVGVLRELGLEEIVQRNPHAKVYGVVFSSPRGDVIEIPFPGKGGVRGYGYCSTRSTYDNLLFQHAKQQPNVTAVEEFKVTDLLREDNQVVGVKGIHVPTREPREYRAKLVIGADGSNSVVAQKVGVHEIDPAHYCIAIRAYYKNVGGKNDMIEIHFLDEVLPGYFWIFPVEEGIVNVGVGMVMKEMRQSKVKLEEALQNALNNPLFKERFQNAELLGGIKGWTLPFGSKRRKAAGDGWMLVGDAASLIDPFSGEGIGNAMLSGQFAAKRAHEALAANNFSASYLSVYEERLWKEIGGELHASYMLQKIGRVTWLLNLIIGKAAKNRHLQDLISGMLVNDIPRKELYSPWFLLKVFFSPGGTQVPPSGCSRM